MRESKGRREATWRKQALQLEKFQDNPLFHHNGSSRNEITKISSLSALPLAIFYSQPSFHMLSSHVTDQLPWKHTRIQTHIWDFKVLIVQNTGAQCEHWLLSGPDLPAFLCVCVFVCVCVCVCVLVFFPDRSPDYRSQRPVETKHCYHGHTLKSGVWPKSIKWHGAHEHTHTQITDESNSYLGFIMLL